MAELYNKRPNDGGVSESIGFLLIFTIVIAGIGLVTLYGYPLLLHQQVSADEKIMEKNMIVLQNDVKSLAYKTVPFKETSLKIGGGSLTVYNSSYNLANSPKLTIEYPTGTIVVDSFKSGELSYESVSAQTDISLQNGAVVMRPRIQTGSTMLADPRWFYDAQTKTMVINLINITSDNIIAKEGIGTVRMKLVDTNYTSFDVSPPGGVLTVRYTPQTDKNYEVAWRNYFTKSLNMGGAGPYTLTGVNKLVVKKYDVKIESI